MKNCYLALAGPGIHKHAEAAAAGGTVNSEFANIEALRCPWCHNGDQKPLSMELLDAARLVRRILGLNWRADSFMVPGGKRQALLPILIWELCAGPTGRPAAEPDGASQSLGSCCSLLLGTHQQGLLVLCNKAALGTNPGQHYLHPVPKLPSHIPDAGAPKAVAQARIPTP